MLKFLILKKVKKVFLNTLQKLRVRLVNDYADIVSAIIIVRFVKIISGRHAGRHCCHAPQRRRPPATWTGTRTASSGLATWGRRATGGDKNMSIAAVFFTTSFLVVQFWIAQDSNPGTGIYNYKKIISFIVVKQSLFPYNYLNIDTMSPEKRHNFGMLF